MPSFKLSACDSFGCDGLVIKSSGGSFNLVYSAIEVVVSAWGCDGA